MDLHEVPLLMSLLGFGMGAMLANFHMCGIMLVLRAVFNMLVRNASTRGPMCFRCLMFSLSGPCYCSSSADSRGTMLESIVYGSNFGILNWNSPTRLPGNNKTKFPWCLISISLSYHFYKLADEDEYRLRLSTNPIQLVCRWTSLSARYNIVPASTWKGWDRYNREREDKLSKRRLPTNCQKVEKILRALILKATSHHIPSGRHRLNTEVVQTEIF